MHLIRTTVAVIAIASVTIVANDCLSSDTADLEFFEKKIRPLLHQHCVECHGGNLKSMKGGLRLDTADGLEQGGDSGPVITPGDPDSSRLIAAVRYDADGDQMPPEGKLTDKEIELLTSWVRIGAPFPSSGDVAMQVDNKPIDNESARQFWSFRPAEHQPPPQPARESWCRNPIDAFIEAKREERSLQPSSQADRATLIRRLSFDLTGLPLSPEEVDRFATDTRANAYERLVDRLLASPEYGQRQGRLWLDLARYTDATASWLESMGRAYLYRDWVIGAINDDVAYDQFVRRQLATDHLSETGPEDIAALGFLGLSPTYWKELKLPSEIIKVIVADEWEERVDVVSRTFLGLTVACARCHDHKFDPISMDDYYGLAGVIASCRLTERPLIEESLYMPVRAAKAKVLELESEIAKLKKEKTPAVDQIAELTAKIETIRTSTAYYDAPLANALVDESMYVVRAGKTSVEGTRLEYRNESRDLHRFIRGDPNHPGPLAPRRFLKVLSRESALPFQHNSGRKELADAIVDDAASLTARVMVNRIWASHFGVGIVTTPSNFGQLGDRPTHPELLDDLAAGFIESGWSIKKLHRQIVLSATYRQSSQDNEQLRAIDPSNQFLWRANRRRLDFESWRDAMLFASGQLDRRFDGPSQGINEHDNRRRTVYATVHRRDFENILQIHDFPAPTAHSARRFVTTTPLQGLFVLNGPLLAKQADSLDQRLTRERHQEPRLRMERAYKLLYGRSATEREVQIGLPFLDRTTAELRGEAWIQYLHALLGSNEFLFVD